MSLQAEQEILATILMNPHMAKDCDLESHEFSNDVYSDIYGEIKIKVDDGEQFDFITLSEAFEESAPNQAQFLIKAMSDIVERSMGSKTMLRDYCGMVRKSYRLKQIEMIFTEGLREVREGKNLDAGDSVISQLMQMDHVGRKHDWSIEEAVKESLRKIEEAAECEGLIGVDTGLDQLNEATGGFRETDLIIIGGRPAMGKTAFLINLANSSKVPVGIISGEQPYDQVGSRFVAIEGSCDAQKMRTATLSDEFVDQMGRTARRLISRQVRINDRTGITIGQLCRQAREWKHKYEIKALYVDYLQKIKSGNPKHDAKQAAAEVSGSLKNLAKELGIPVICLAQVNRGVDSRPDSRPNMGDLSNAGEIEQEADLILMLYRDEVYNEDTPDKGIIELLLEKNRHGPTGRIRAAWIGKYMQVKNLTAQTYNGDY